MRDHLHHKSWTGPWGPFYRKKRSPAAKWVIAIVTAAVVFIAFSVILARSPLMYYSGFENLSVPVYWVCLVAGAISAACWCLSYTPLRLIDMRWRRVSKVVFGWSCITPAFLMASWLAAAGLVLGGVVEPIDSRIDPAHSSQQLTCAPDCHWWHYLWDDNMWLQRGKYNSE